MQLSTQIHEAPVVKTAVSVDAVGETVVLKIGNVTYGLDYVAAIKIGAWLRFNGQIAKRAAGDSRRIFTVMGHLEDAEEAYRLNLKEIT